MSEETAAAKQKQLDEIRERIEVLSRTDPAMAELWSLVLVFMLQELREIKAAVGRASLGIPF